MANYAADRAFTNHVHNAIALPEIYAPLGWQKVLVESNFAEHIDLHKGIDYVFKKDGVLKTVQERFRESKYQHYADFTIRYRRDDNPDVKRHESEYYKMKAAYFTYGIVNGLKYDMDQCTGFIKFAVVDMKVVYAKIDEGLIKIESNGRNTCQLVAGKIICPVKYNTDGSSSFFPVEIGFLVKLWGNEIIIAQKGFM